MALTKRPPNTIILGPMDDPGTVVNEFSAGVAITPGMIVEFYDVGSGKMKLRPKSSATTSGAPMVAVEKLIHNKTVNDVYAVNDLVNVVHLEKGSTFWPCVPSGETITAGDFGQDNGDGWLKEATSTAASGGVARYQFLETLGAVTTLTRVRTLVL